MKEITEIFLIDTNLLVYAYDKTDKQKHEIAKNLLAECWERKRIFAVSSQNLAEFFIIITKKVPMPVPIEEAEQIIADICAFSHWRILHYTQATVQHAIYLYKKNKKHFWDAMIAATMLEAGIFYVYTEDTCDFEKFEHIKVINPFD